MKFIIVFISLSILYSCNQEKMENEITKLKGQNELIREQSASKDQFIEEYATTLNDVYSNLEKIREREGLITAYSQTLEAGDQPKLKEKMLSNIESINNYISRSKSKLNALKSRFKESELASKTFELALEKLTKELEEKELYIAELLNEIDQLNKQVTDANFAIKEREMIIEEQNDHMNLAYYIIGDNEALENKKIIKEKGGFLGILGKTTVVSSELNLADFNMIDLSVTPVIKINHVMDDIAIISEHSPDSYKLINDSVSTLISISDPDEFWKMRYLVIAINK